VSALVWQYSYLQVLDFLSTIAFLLMGIQEGNPLVRLALQLAPTPLYGLAAVKLIAVALGIYCSKMGKARLLARINVLFALVVVWNLVAVIFGVAQLGLANQL
jgi:hypothetical protein